MVGSLEIVPDNAVPPGGIVLVPVLTPLPWQTIAAFRRRLAEASGLIVGLPISAPEPVRVAFPDA